jgi:hypothetical protein
MLPVDPVEDVEPPVGAQREEVVAGDGLRLSGLAHHEQLEKISNVSVLTITDSRQFRADPDPSFHDEEDDGCELVKGLVTQYALPELDPYVFGPPGSGSVFILYGSVYGSFHQQANVPTVYSKREPI